MDSHIYSGYFIVSIQAERGVRYMTLVGNQVQLHTDRNKAMLIRLYSRPYGGILASAPLTLNGKEGEYHLDLVFNGDIGQGNLIARDGSGRRIDFRQQIGPEGGQTIIMLGGSLLGCSAGHNQASHLFRLSPENNGMFRPHPWTFQPASVASFADGDLRFLNVERDNFSLNAPRSNLSGAALSEARLCGSILNNVKFNNTVNYKTVFGEINQGSKLDDTTWNEASCLNANFSKCSLQRANFSGAEFSMSKDKAMFPFPGVVPPKFINADLRDADFKTCDLRGVDFTNADLRGAKLNGALMDKCILTGADLSGADLSNTNLKSVIFADKRPRLSPEKLSTSDRKTILRSTQLKASLLGLVWNNLDLTNATISDIPTDLSTLKATQSNLKSVDFTKRKLTGADFRSSTLDDINFDSADLSNADLSNLDLKKVSMKNTTLSAAKVDGADLSGLDLTSVEISSPITGSTDPKRRTKLRKTKLNADLFGKVWTALDMADAIITKLATTDLTGMQASDVILTDVTLNGANFNSIKSDSTSIITSFLRASFHGANLQRTQFKNAILEGAQFGAYRPVFRMLASDAEALPALLAQQLNSVATQTEGHLLRAETSSGDPALLLRYETRANGEQELLMLAAAVPANLSNAYLAGANLKNANLEGVIANGVHIYGGEGGRSQLEGAMMSRINLVGANLGSADLTKAQLQGANLNGANLVGAKLDHADLSPAKNGQDVLLTDLTGAYLAGASFENAKLNGAIFTGAAIPSEKGVYLFTLDNVQAIKEIKTSKSENLSFKDYRSDLNKLNLGELSKKLKAKDFSINEGAKLSKVASDPVKWEIVTDNATYRLDLVTEDGSKLTVNDDKQLDSKLLSNHLAALHNNQLDVLIPAFKEIGITLTESTKIVAKDPQRPSGWKISNNSPDPDLLLSTEFYKTGKNYLYINTQRDLILVRNEFKIKKMGLQAGAKLQAEGKDQWLLSNEIADLDGIHTGYVEFRLVAEEIDSVAVFGTKLQVVRLGEQDRQQVFPTVLKKPDGFDNKIMDGETYCPNGERLKDLGVDNWNEKWLRTNAAPKPPKCIPTKNGWCPIE
ncbi:pentapeptide repeat-containing protein [Undibacterium sp. JH2W]|uniref:pentapeptide repeat-containing protein n=1 Tax=Undibacterium sp. JH2W TaxID=3413037 RepID=UPI003BEF4DC9